jgi:hypothetical protein
MKHIFRYSGVKNGFNMRGREALRHRDMPDKNLLSMKRSPYFI